MGTGTTKFCGPMTFPEGKQVSVSVKVAAVGWGHLALVFQLAKGSTPIGTFMAPPAAGNTTTPGVNFAKKIE